MVVLGWGTFHLLTLQSCEAGQIHLFCQDVLKNIDISLHSPSVLGDRSILFNALQSSRCLSVFKETSSYWLVPEALFFSAFIGPRRSANL